MGKQFLEMKLGLVSKIVVFVKKQQFLFGIILITSAVALILNIIVNPQTVFLSGESQFSFDYGGHINNIITYFIHNNNGLLHLNECSNCPGFYGYSRWVALATFIFGYFGEILHMHYFIFQMFFVVLVQVVSLYIFLKTFLKGNVSKYSFLVAATVFIILPVNLLYVGQFTFFIWYSQLLLSLSLTKYIFDRIRTASFMQGVIYALTWGSLFSLWLNIGIGFLPVIFYTMLGFGLYYHKIIIENFKKILFVFLPALIIPFCNISFSLW